MLYELINMSDPYTFKADSLECAAVVTVLLGSGQYSAKLVDGEGEGVPFFMFGGSDEWWTKNFGHAVNDNQFIDGDRLPELLTALRSVLIGSEQDRLDYEDATSHMVPTDVDEYRVRRHDRLRSSMNDIGGRALKIAASLEKKVEIPKAPPQVFVG